MWNSLLFLIVILFSLIILIDAIPEFYIWQSRIKIGRFANKEVWKNRMLKKSVQWLYKTPTIKLTDNKRLIIIDILKGNYKRNSIQSWQEAALLLGLSAQKDGKKQQHVANFIRKKIDNSGNWKIQPQEVDSAILAFAIMKAEPENIFNYKPAFDEIFNLINNLKGEDGTVAYRMHQKDYRYVDTLGFICPFLINYGLEFNNTEAIDLSLKQIFEYRKYGFHQITELPYHTYQVSTKYSVGLSGWGRGLAWFLIGLMDSYKILPEDHSQKKDLKKLVYEVAKSSLLFQEQNGGFHWLLTDSGSRLDSSVTSVLAWFYSECEYFSEIGEDCKVAKEKALVYLQSVTRRDGAIDFSQGDTKGIGVYSQNFEILPFTQGFCLRAIL